MHRNLLCTASPVFEAAFTGEGSFVETRTQTFDLDSSEVSIKTLEHLVQWLYSNDYELPETAGIVSPHDRYIELTDLYVFAEKYVIVDLKNSIIRELWRLHETKVPSSTPIRRIYDNTPGSSPCRRLLAAGYAWKISLAWYDKPSASKHLSCHTDFGADVAIQLARRFSGNHLDPFDGDASEFYVTSTTEKRHTEIENVLEARNGDEMES